MTDVATSTLDEDQIRSFVQHQQWAIHQRGRGDGLRPVCCPRHEAPFCAQGALDGTFIMRCPRAPCQAKLLTVPRELTDWSWNQGFSLHAGTRCHCTDTDEVLFGNALVWKCVRCGRACAPCWAGTHLDEGDVCEPCLAVHPTGFAPGFDVVHVTEDHPNHWVARKRAAARVFMQRPTETPVGVIGPDSSSESTYLVVLADLERGVAHQNACIECSRLGHRPGRLGTDDPKGPHRCLRCGKMLSEDDQVESETFMMSSIVPPPGASGSGWVVRTGKSGLELVAGDRVLGQNLAPELGDWLVDEARLARRDTGNDVT